MKKVPDAMPERLEENPAMLENRMIADLEKVFAAYDGAGFTSVQALGVIRLLELRLIDRLWPRRREAGDG